MNTTTVLPAGIPPEGVLPDFVDPPSLAPIYRGVTYCFVPLMLVFLVARLYIRLRVLREFWFDDFFSIMGACTIVSYVGILIPLFDKPIGRHMWDVPITDFNERFLIMVTFVLVIGLLAVWFIKASLLTLFLRLFRIYRSAFWLIWGGIAAISIFYSVSFILIFERCAPRSGQTWTIALSQPKCVEIQDGTSKASGVFGLVSDLYILAIPVWFISHLALPSKRKAGVLAIFLTGFLACAMAAGAMITRFQYKDNDGTYSMLYAFGILEVNIGNICACMPILGPLLKRSAEGFLSLWQTINHYYRLATNDNYRNQTDTTQASADTKESSGKLPQIPRGVFTGLRTFIRRNNRTNTNDTELQSRGDDDVLLSQDSTAYSYHSHMRNMYEHDVERDAGSERGDDETLAVPRSSHTRSHKKSALSR